ncbi:MAG: HEAT repeat domain-containing protein [PVC group bacterium]|nr:HEAT repeat domain-containing protein [PVC group bacterium]
MPRKIMFELVTVIVILVGFISLIVLFIPKLSKSKKKQQPPPITLTKTSAKPAKIKKTNIVPAVKKPLPEKKVPEQPIINNNPSGLIKQLTDKDPKQRIKACQALGELDYSAPEIIESLTEKLNDPDIQVKTAAAEALGKIGQSNNETISLLTSGLKNQNRYFAQACGQALLQMGKAAEPATKIAIQGINNPMCKARTESAMIAKKFNANEAMPNFAYAFYTERGWRTEVRTLTPLQQVAFDALKEYGPKATPYILPALEKKFVIFPKKCKELLVHYGNDALDYLEHALKYNLPPDKKERYTFKKHCQEAIDAIKAAKK